MRTSHTLGLVLVLLLLVVNGRAEPILRTYSHVSFGSGTMSLGTESTTLWIDWSIFSGYTTVVTLDVPGSIQTARGNSVTSVVMIISNTTVRSEAQIHIGGRELPLDLDGAMDVSVEISDTTFVDAFLLFQGLVFSKPSPSKPKLLSGAVLLRRVTASRAVKSASSPVTEWQFLLGLKTLSLGRFDIIDSSFIIAASGARVAAIVHVAPVQLGNGNATPTAVWLWSNVSLDAQATGPSGRDAVAHEFYGAPVTLSASGASWVLDKCVFRGWGGPGGWAKSLLFWTQSSVLLSGRDSQFVIQNSVMSAVGANGGISIGSIFFYGANVSVSAPGARWGLLDTDLDVGGVSNGNGSCIFFHSMTVSLENGGSWYWSNVNCTNTATLQRAFADVFGSTVRSGEPPSYHFLVRCLRRNGSPLALPSTAVPLSNVTASLRCGECDVRVDCAPGRATGIADNATCTCACTQAALSEGVALGPSCAAALPGTGRRRVTSTHTHSSTLGTATPTATLSGSLSVPSASTSSSLSQSQSQSLSLSLSPTHTPTGETDTHTATATHSLRRPPVITPPRPNPPVAEEPTVANVSTTVTAVAAAATSTAVVLGAIAGGGGAGGGAELQTLVMFGLGECADATVRAIAGGGSEAALSPWALTNTTEGSLAGSALLALLTVVAQLLLVVLLHFRTRKGRTASLGAAFAAYSFPSHASRVFTLLYQGMCFDAARLAAGSNGDAGKGVGFAALFLLLAVPVVSAWWFAVLCEVPFAAYEHAFVAVPSPVRALLLPCGYWSPRQEPQSKWSAAFAGLRGPNISLRRHAAGTRVRLALASVVGLPHSLQWVLAVLVNTNVSCTSQSGALVVCIAGSIIATVTMRPQRIRFGVLSRIAMQTTLLFVAAIGVVPSLRPSAEKLSLAVFGLGLATTAISVAVQLAERCVWRLREKCGVAAAASVSASLLLTPTLTLPQAGESDEGVRGSDDESGDGAANRPSLLAEARLESQRGARLEHDELSEREMHPPPLRSPLDRHMTSPLTSFAYSPRE